MVERTELIGGIPFTKGEYAHIRKHIGEHIAQEIEALEIRVSENLIVDPSMLAREAVRMTQYMAASAARGKNA